MTLAELLEALGLADSYDLLAPHWDGPATQVPWLAPALVAWAREFTGLPAELDRPLARMAELVRHSPELVALMAHQASLLFDHRDYDAWQASRWPTLEHLLGADWGLFHLLLAFGALPRMLARHRERGIPEAVSRACCTHFTETNRLFGYVRPGQHGYPPRALFWLRNHVDGVLIKLGRLEYMVRPFSGRVRVYRHRGDGRVVALLMADLLVNRDGCLDAGATEGWRTLLTEEDGALVGHVAHPGGYALPDPVRLPLREWQAELLPGDPILEVHIPAGGHMALESCVDSMRQALEFFPRHFPDQPFRGFATHSWIFDPQIALWYGPDCNMARWQRELYLFPCPSGGRDGLYFLFGEGPTDPAEARRDTELQRRILDHLAAGGSVRSTGMFCLLPELARAGSQPYLSGWRGGV